MSATERPHIVVLTAPDEDDLPGLEAIDGQADVVHARDEQTLATQLRKADILVVTDFRTDILEQVWPDQHHIRWVHATSAGVDALMFDALIDSDLVVTNAAGIFDRGIAEYVLGAIALFAKDTLGNLRYQREHRWCHRETAMLRDALVVVVGAGSVGRAVGSLVRAVGMRAVGIATSAREDNDFDEVRGNDELHDWLGRADYVVLTLPLTDSTRHLIDAGALASMRKSACLVNVARGPIVDTDALIAALRNGQLAGAALDVFESEPLPEDHPLWEMPQVMISAHMAGDFIGWRRALGEQFVDNFGRFSRGEELGNIVDTDRD